MSTVLEVMWTAWIKSYQLTA